jgi:hypothetical protein
MTEKVSVVEDGVAGTQSRPASRPSWIVGVVGFALGLGLGVLVVGPTPDGPSTPTPLTTPSGEPPVATIDPAPTDSGVVGAIPGFPDAVVAIATTSGSSLDHILWPHEGAVRVSPMSGGRGVVLDAGAQYVALADTVPGLEGNLLSMGRYNSTQPVTSGVTSYAWHDSTPGWLGYATASETGTEVFTVKGDLVPHPVVTLPDSDARVIGWGEWGWALQRDDGSVELLTPEGEFKDTEIGSGYATHPSGWVFMMEDGSAKLVSGGGGVRRVAAPLGVGDVTTASFSPDGAMVAVSGARGVVILDIDGGDVVGLNDFPAPSLVWSSDSRFVLIPSQAGIMVFDLVDGEVHRLLRQYPIVALGVVPLRSS